MAKRLEDPSNLADAAKSGEHLGSGSNGAVYAIPGEEDLVVKIPHAVVKRGPQEAASAERAHNAFGDMNVGQPLARVGRVEILLRQRGEPAGMTATEPAYDRDDRDDVYRARIEAAASMPQSAYDRLASDLLRANELGYILDWSKDNNILVDPKSGRFGLVDLGRRNLGEMNQMGNVILCLIGYRHAFSTPHMSADLAPSRRKISLMSFEAAKRASLPIEFSGPVFDRVLAMVGLTRSDVPKVRLADSMAERVRDELVEKERLERERQDRAERWSSGPEMTRYREQLSGWKQRMASWREQGSSGAPPAPPQHPGDPG
jgi:hypothetical protein